MTEKIKVTSITLIHATGAIDIGEGTANGIIAGTTVQVTSFAEADDVLARWQQTNHEGHFNKIDWSISYEDGFERFGTLEIGRPRNEIAARPDFVGATSAQALRLTNNDPADDGYRQFVDKDGRHRKFAQELLSKYDFGVETPPTSGLKM